MHTLHSHPSLSMLPRLPATRSCAACKWHTALPPQQGGTKSSGSTGFNATHSASRLASADQASARVPVSWLLSSPLQSVSGDTAQGGCPNAAMTGALHGHSMGAAGSAWRRCFPARAAAHTRCSVFHSSWTGVLLQASDGEGGLRWRLQQWLLLQAVWVAGCCPRG